MFVVMFFTHGGKKKAKKGAAGSENTRHMSRTSAAVTSYVCTCAIKGVTKKKKVSFF